MLVFSNDFSTVNFVTLTSMGLVGDEWEKICYVPRDYEHLACCVLSLVVFSSLRAHSEVSGSTYVIAKYENRLVGVDHITLFILNKLCIYYLPHIMQTLGYWKDV